MLCVWKSLAWNKRKRLKYFVKLIKDIRIALPYRQHFGGEILISNNIHSVKYKKCWVLCANNKRKKESSEGITSDREIYRKSYFSWNYKTTLEAKLENNHHIVFRAKRSRKSKQTYKKKRIRRQILLIDKILNGFNAKLSFNLITARQFHQNEQRGKSFKWSHWMVSQRTTRMTFK